MTKKRSISQPALTALTPFLSPSVEEKKTCAPRPPQRQTVTLAKWRELQAENRRLRARLAQAEAGLQNHLPANAGSQMELELSRDHYADPFMVDITAQRQAEETACQNAIRFRALIENASETIACLDAGGIIRFQSPNVHAMLGYTRAEIEAHSVFDFIHPDDQPAAKDLFAELLAAPGANRSATLRVRHADGSWRWMEIGCKNLLADPAISSIVLNSRDITCHKHAENEILRLNQTLEERVRQRTVELSESTDRLRGILDGAQIGIIVFNPGGIIESVNPASERIFGYLPGELVGLQMHRLIEAAPHAERPLSWTPMFHAPAAAVPQEAIGRRKDGAAIVLELSLITSTSGGQQQLVAMVNDITERNRLEQELLEVGDRERQRLGNELHDGLGQQLHGIYFMTTFLRDTLRKESPARAQQAEALMKHLATALDLTRSLARGLQPVGNRAEDLMETLKDLAERTREMYRVDCHFICRTPVLVHGHSAANHLFRIAQEAVNNALKHGRPTRLRIQLAHTPKRLILSVSDNGRGIQPSRPGHSGLGLHIMQHRANAIHGSLVIKRVPQGGTQVLCTVPRHHLTATVESTTRVRANCPRPFCVSVFPRSRMENDATKTHLNQSTSKELPAPPPPTADGTRAEANAAQWQL